MRMRVNSCIIEVVVTGYILGSEVNFWLRITLLTCSVEIADNPLWLGKSE